ncbi:hypothetical protein ACHAXT_011312 [Thalassiosira profunda]
MGSTRSPRRPAAVAALSIAIVLRGKPHSFFSASAFTVQRRRCARSPHPSACGGLSPLPGSRRPTFLQSSIASAASETSVQPEILVEESPADNPLDESSTVVHAARLAEKGECEGYLIRKPDNAYEAHLSCSSANVDQFAAVFHTLLLPYLAVERELYEEERDGSSDKRTSALRVLVGDEVEDSLAKELERIGISNQPKSESNGDGLGINLPRYIPFLNEFAFRQRGTDQGIAALHALKLLSERRVPFDFAAHEMHPPTIDGERRPQRRTNVVSRQKQVLPLNEIDAVMRIVNEIKARKWLSDNPDSVDGLPSLHLNLITNGKPLFERSDDDDDESEVTFSRCISDMVDILRPYLYDDLLPEVRKLTNSSAVEISDVFIRNYGRVDDRDEGAARYGLSAHYDVTAATTSVIAMDDTAAAGTQGLYTIPPSPKLGASGHAALRRFFPLAKGDGVVHTYDVLHGVDNKARTSLIVWFTDGVDEDEDKTVNQPWLLNPTDDIGEFVLGLASESVMEEDGSHALLKNAIDQYAMYLKSASRGNIFAMTALAQMCDDERVPDSEYRNIYDLASQEEYNPFLPRTLTKAERTPACRDFAQALWYRASIQGGHRAAQVALADDIMLQYMSQREELSTVEQENMLTMASTLFTMALARGDDSQETLERLMTVECDRLSELGVEIPSDDFFASPVVRILLAFRQ